MVHNFPKGNTHYSRVAGRVRCTHEPRSSRDIYTREITAENKSEQPNYNDHHDVLGSECVCVCVCVSKLSCEFVLRCQICPATGN